LTEYKNLGQVLRQYDIRADKNNDYIDIADLDKLYSALHFVLEDCKKQLTPIKNSVILI
jgi:hypothetical protein